jgi:RNA polymerase sigma factor (sigma-70 family)
LDAMQAGNAQDRAAQVGVSGALLAHLDAAHNLAHWLTGNDHDAQDIVQEAYLRAVRAADTFRGGDMRSWLLSIVRNLCFDMLRRKKILPMASIEDDARAADSADEFDPARILQSAENIEQVRVAVAALEPEFREVVILREMEQMSYKEIASLTGVPMGTVMSRVARARRHLARILSEPQGSSRLEQRT